MIFSIKLYLVFLLRHGNSHIGKLCTLYTLKYAILAQTWTWYMQWNVSFMSLHASIGDSGDDLIRRTWANAAQVGLFRIQLQSLPSKVDPASWRKPNLVAVVDSANLPSASGPLVLLCTIQRTKRWWRTNRFDDKCVAKWLPTRSPTNRLFVHVPSNFTRTRARAPLCAGWAFL